MRAIWSGAPVIGGGVTTLYVEQGATGFVADIRAFFEAIKAAIPTGTTITVPASGDLIDDATGGLTGSWSDTGAAAVICSGAGAYISGTGVRVSWQTDGIRNGRRVRGSTFVAPVAANNFDTDGLPTAAAVTLISGAANTLRAALPAELLVWSRPSGVGAGQSSTVIGSSVPDAASWLRSRRT